MNFNYSTKNKNKSNNYCKNIYYYTIKTHLIIKINKKNFFFIIYNKYYIYYN